MSRLLIESGPHETRVALVEENRVVEVQIEDPLDRGAVGNIYKGRVSKVLPGIEAAFVNIALERDAFLYAGDINGRPPIDEDLSELGSEARGSEAINNLIREDDELLVQVIKDALPSKGARITAQITVPGRFVVLLPGAEDVGVSRRLTDPDERERLASLLEAIRPQGVGLIARTAAAGRSQQEIHRDFDRLMRVWSQIQRTAAKTIAPGRVHSELDLPMRVIRDQPIDQLEEILIDGNEIYDDLGNYLEELDPELRQRLSRFDGPGQLFETAGVDTAIQKALRGRVWLPSGGYIVISPTEALVAIDINTGRYIGSEDIETTALKVNSEAAVEVARQVRLRDLSGIIIVDFIDMERPEHRKEVLDIFGTELQKDRTRIHISGMSELGLVEVTRKRSRNDLSRRLTGPCPCCQGRGRVRTPKAVCLEMRRALVRLDESHPDRPFHVELHPQVAQALEGDLNAILEEIEVRIGAAIELRQDAALKPDEFKIVSE